MDLSQLNLIVTSGRSAASRVASALSSPRAVQATPKHTTTPTTSTTNTSSAASSSTITSSDFLTLLVSELKNQDPTQPTDPNAYISQLVGVNSLEQLIQINSGLTTTGSVSGTNSGASANAVAATNSVSGTQLAANPNSIWGGATSS